MPRKTFEIPIRQYIPDENLPKYLRRANRKFTWCKKNTQHKTRDMYLNAFRSGILAKNKAYRERKKGGAK